MEPWRARTPLWNERQNAASQRLRLRRRDSAAGDVHDLAPVHLRGCFHGIQNVPGGQFAAVELRQSGLLRAGHVEDDAQADVDLRHTRYVEFESPQPS